MRIRGRLTWLQPATLDLGGFRIRFSSGAFEKGIEGTSRPLALVDHDDDKLIGKEGVNSRIWDDGKGLMMAVRCRIHSSAVTPSN